MPLPRRDIKQILRADDRGGCTAASRMSQRARAWRHSDLARTAPLTSPGPPRSERSRSAVGRLS
jgi:hypothetical protein